VNLLTGRRARDDQLSRTFTRNGNVIQFAGIKMGFAEAGVLKTVGHKFKKCIDVGLWQLSVA
jgi:L-amino acid N-acyltransferase YncA